MRNADCFCNEEQGKRIKDYVERGTAVARKRFQHAETAIKQEQEDMRNAEMVAWTTRKPEQIVEEMLNAWQLCLHDLASSGWEEEGEDQDHDEEDTELDKMSEDDKHS